MTDNAHPAPSEIPDDVKPVLAASRALLSRIGGVALLVESGDLQVDAEPHGAGIR